MILGDLFTGFTEASMLRSALSEAELCKEVRGVTMDSRKAGEGIIFVACRGATAASSDGHDFIDAAIKKGSRVIVAERGDVEGATLIKVSESKKVLAELCERFNGSASKELKMIGLTGTNGKTTTSFFVAQLLEALEHKTSVFGTLGIGHWSNPRYTGFTTPEPETLSASLRELKDEGYEYVAMEVSSHALHTDRVAAMQYDVSAFTNLSPEHLDLHESMDAYFECKATLFSKHTRGKIVLCQREEDYSKRLASRFSDALFYGVDVDADVSATKVRQTQRGLSFELNLAGLAKSIELDVIGDFNVENALCAYACALALGFSPSAIVDAAEALGAVPGRMQPVRANDDAPMVVVDFSHTPDALENALTTLRKSCEGKLWTLFGCGGDRDAQKRPLMASVCERLSDGVIVTNDNPRSENPSDIAQAIEGGFKKFKASNAPSVGHFARVLDRREAIEKVIALASPEDVILLAGKGHEKTQTFANETLPFDDVLTAREALLQRGENA